MSDNWFSDLLARWRRSSDRDRIVFLLILGTFFFGASACGVFSRLDQGYSLAFALIGGENLGPLPFGLAGLLMLLGAVAIGVKRRS